MSTNPRPAPSQPKSSVRVPYWNRGARPIFTREADETWTSDMATVKIVSQEG